MHTLRTYVHTLLIMHIYQHPCKEWRGEEMHVGFLVRLVFFHLDPTTAVDSRIERLWPHRPHNIPSGREPNLARGRPMFPCM
jgi:hypothetical protein